MQYALVKKEMLAENSVPCITQTAFPESLPKFQIHQPLIQLFQRFHIATCANARTCLLARHMQPYFKTYVKNESYVGRYTD